MADGMDDVIRIIQDVVVVAVDENARSPDLKITERCLLYDLDTREVTEIPPTSAEVDRVLHKERGGFEFDEIEVGHDEDSLLAPQTPNPSAGDFENFVPAQQPLQNPNVFHFGDPPPQQPQHTPNVFHFGDAPAQQAQAPSTILPPAGGFEDFTPQFASTPKLAPSENTNNQLESTPVKSDPNPAQQPQAPSINLPPSGNFEDPSFNFTPQFASTPKLPHSANTNIQQESTTFKSDPTPAQQHGLSPFPFCDASGLQLPQAPNITPPPAGDFKDFAPTFASTPKPTQSSNVNYQEETNRNFGAISAHQLTAANPINQQGPTIYNFGTTAAQAPNLCQNCGKYSQQPPQAPNVCQMCCKLREQPTPASNMPLAPEGDFKDFAPGFASTPKPTQSANVIYQKEPKLNFETTSAEQLSTNKLNFGAQPGCSTTEIKDGEKPCRACHGADTFKQLSSQKIVQFNVDPVTLPAHEGYEEFRPQAASTPNYEDKEKSFNFNPVQPKETRSAVKVTPTLSTGQQVINFVDHYQDAGVSKNRDILPDVDAFEEFKPGGASTPKGRSMILDDLSRMSGIAPAAPQTTRRDPGGSAVGLPGSSSSSRRQDVANSIFATHLQKAKKREVPSASGDLPKSRSEIRLKTGMIDKQERWRPDKPMRI